MSAHKQISTLAVGCVIATFHPKFRHPTWRAYRATMYSGLGLSAIIFIVHGILLFGYEQTSRNMSLNWMGLMAVFNFTGRGIYAARVNSSFSPKIRCTVANGCKIPEKWHEKKYDILSSSHQILHVMVILAELAHMVGLLRVFEHIHGRNDSWTTPTCSKIDPFLRLGSMTR